MLSKRYLAVTAVGAFSGSARAGGAPIVPKSLQAACGSRMAGARRAVALGDHMQEAVYHVWLKKGRALVSVTSSENPCGDGPTCTVIPIARPHGQLAGKIGAGGAQATAFVVASGNCEASSCGAMLA